MHLCFVYGTSLGDLKYLSGWCFVMEVALLFPFSSFFSFSFLFSPKPRLWVVLSGLAENLVQRGNVQKEEAACGKKLNTPSTVFLFYD